MRTAAVKHGFSRFALVACLQPSHRNTDGEWILAHSDFQSKNCMRELVSSTLMKKPIVALVDPDASRGGLSQKDVRVARASSYV